MEKGLLIDFTKCVGCGACMDACREANNLPKPEPDDAPPIDLSAQDFTVVLSKEVPGKGTVYFRRLCMHCEDPACVSVCPIAALTKREDGAVVYDADRCFGCRYCINACPFQVPRYEWMSNAPRVRKCILCYPRLQEGQEPACAAACPTGATIFGPRETLLRIAHERIRAHPDRYVNHVFGEHEAGGTQVLMLSPVDFSELGFRTDVPTHPLPELTWRVQKNIPYVVATGSVFLGGLWWIINRRMELAQEEQPGDAN